MLSHFFLKYAMPTNYLTLLLKHKIILCYRPTIKHIRDPEATKCQINHSYSQRPKPLLGTRFFIVSIKLNLIIKNYEGGLFGDIPQNKKKNKLTQTWYISDSYSIPKGTDSYFNVDLYSWKWTSSLKYEIALSHKFVKCSVNLLSFK